MMSDVRVLAAQSFHIKGYDRRCFLQTGRWREAGVVDRTETDVNRGPRETEY